MCRPGVEHFAGHIFVVDSLRFSDDLINDSPLSHLTASTRKILYAQLLEFKEVLILDRDVIPHLRKDVSKNRNGKEGKHWAPDTLGRVSSLTHHMDLSESNRLCAVKMKTLWFTPRPPSKARKSLAGPSWAFSSGAQADR